MPHRIMTTAGFPWREATHSVTPRALQSRLQLSVKKVDKYGIIPECMVVPGFIRYLN